jgi:hypothetical protein
MTIQDALLEPYRIEVDESQFSVYRFTGKTDKNGYEVKDYKGYFSKLSTALHKIVKIKMSEDNSTISLGHYIKQYDKIYNSLTKIVNHE